ncbi:MAG: M48 family metallopeptidase [Candidatus Pacebacteria bacterium]|nr:M48 family metallopeptidase [Candidatus Paceibacterota bacterium]
MKKDITLKNKKISYTLKKSTRARRMRLAVYCDGSIVVTTPLGLRGNIVEKFLTEKTQWLFTKLNFFKQFEGKAITKYSHEDYLKFKKEACILAENRISYFNKTYKLKYNKISIKNQKTRWGSCSKKGNLNFNYKIALLPEKISDYIIVHELCHLKEFNHSKKFWNLVAKAIPDYLEIKKDLKKSGYQFYK